MELSKGSQDFLDNLRVYLFAGGKNEQEINDIVGELQDHLYEAERNGKSVEDIIGASPKEYMEQIASEMSLDYKAIIKYIPVFILGFFAFVILGDVIRNGIHYTWVQIIGYPLTACLLLVLTMGVFRYLASHKISRGVEISLLMLLSIMNIGAFVLLLFLKDAVGTIIVELDGFGNMVTGIVATLILLFLAITSKTWVSVLIPAFIYIPEIILGMTQITEEVQLITSSILTFILLISYMLMILKTEKKRSSR